MSQSKVKSSSSVQDDTGSIKSDTTSSLGSSIIVLPCLSDEVSLNRGSDSELGGTPSSSGSSVVVVDEVGDDGELVSSGEGGGARDVVDDDLTSAATELWLTTSNYTTVKRRRVHSDPTPTPNLMEAGLTHSLLFDQLSDLVGMEPTSTWGSDVDPIYPSAPNLAVPSWSSDQGSVSVPPPSAASDVMTADDVTTPRRTTYTDEVLNGIFKDILENIGLYNDEYESLASHVATMVEENQHLRGRVYLLEWESDNMLQKALSNRILIINVPTKMSSNTLRMLVVRVAHRVGVYLEPEDITDVYYMFRRPSKTSPVIVIFMEHALDARRLILSRKSSLQRLSMRTLEGFRRYSGNICVDEQLIGRRNELKQAARRVVKQGRLLATWVLDGNVFVRDNSNRKHVIESKEALDKVLE